jgi:zinc D-Ala-D-Ala dipeptidase
LSDNEQIVSRFTIFAAEKCPKFFLFFVKVMCKSFLIIGLLLSFVFVRCDKKEKAKHHFGSKRKATAVLIIDQKPDSMHKLMEVAGLVDIQSLDTSLRVDLKYASTDNFTGKNMYGSLVKAYLQPEIAQKLMKSVQLLQREHSGYRFLVWDAARPRSIQWKLWKAVGGTSKFPEGYVANPKRGSLHNFGCAVDLTILDQSGHQLDMGTAYDYFGDEAWPKKEDSLVSVGKLTFAQVKNRRMLRRIMYKSGFTALDTEWWHFNGCSFSEAQKRYEIIE